MRVSKGEDQVEEEKENPFCHVKDSSALNSFIQHRINDSFMLRNNLNADEALNTFLCLYLHHLHTRSAYTTNKWKEIAFNSSQLMNSCMLQDNGSICWCHVMTNLNETPHFLVLSSWIIINKIKAIFCRKTIALLRSEAVWSLSEAKKQIFSGLCAVDRQWLMRGQPINVNTARRDNGLFHA